MKFSALNEGSFDCEGQNPNAERLKDKRKSLALLPSGAPGSGVRGPASASPARQLAHVGIPPQRGAKQPPWKRGCPAPDGPSKVLGSKLSALTPNPPHSQANNSLPFLFTYLLIHVIHEQLCCFQLLNNVNDHRNTNISSKSCF